ncbi:MAG TPA: pyridoxal phosphate-dependent aminotransferase [Syntrophorhabdaceae bacterium]|nr:pyridoxal phosphate-dependent aminotransferase [Syntrophorhabdaceae bacterium]HOT42488.1 pyridoxal phosphate-dependent aminotransferase [Syntrophorhabdaceae bacterium]HPC65944.1 pyridoxal phosphate-dependent aminotransferase [Syntrophorhabdaceae bacterium]HQE81003.1 pyridoxal phosphate-dependent aminotransferase [Syntrophorhabdaceae bacterium]HQH44098.1 pyridoxal phosphate-dependent aminotransferase [Syntrophorhabdaceae bacterium]
MLSKRAEALKPSPTLAINAKEKALKAQGLDIAGFGAGEPDFDTPEHIKQAAIKAINDNFTRYTPAAGIDPLKDAVIEKFKRDNGLTYKRDEIIISCGGKHALFNLFEAIFQEGDEVLIPVPFWVSYPPMVELTGAKPILVETEEKEDYQVTGSLLKKYINSKTKGIILNYPSNPAGSVYYRENLEEIGRLAVENNLYIISDEIYEKLTYDDYRHISIASLDKSFKDRTIICHGVSKTYAMTGWRIGYAAGPAHVIKAMSNIQSQSTSNPTSISQMAAIAALNGPQDIIPIMVNEFKKRRDFIISELRSIEGVTCYNPKGAFYAFPNFNAILGKRYKDKTIDSSATLTEILLEDFHTAVVPGAEFGKEGYIRLSFATSMDVIKKGLERIKKAVREFR